MDIERWINDGYRLRLIFLIVTIAVTTIESFDVVYKLHKIIKWSLVIIRISLYFLCDLISRNKLSIKIGDYRS